MGILVPDEPPISALSDIWLAESLPVAVFRQDLAWAEGIYAGDRIYPAEVFEAHNK